MRKALRVRLGIMAAGLVVVGLLVVLGPFAVPVPPFRVRPQGWRAWPFHADLAHVLDQRRSGVLYDEGRNALFVVPALPDARGVYLGNYREEVALGVFGPTLEEIKVKRSEIENTLLVAAADGTIHRFRLSRDGAKYVNRSVGDGTCADVRELLFKVTDPADADVLRRALYEELPLSEQPSATAPATTWPREKEPTSEPSNPQRSGP